MLTNRDAGFFLGGVAAVCALWVWTSDGVPVDLKECRTVLADEVRDHATMSRLYLAEQTKVYALTENPKR